MNQLGARAATSLLFVGLLATPFLYKHYVANRAHSAGVPSTKAGAASPYGFALQESAAASGIAFKHRAPTLDPKLSHIMEQVASMGAAVSVVDFDRDGWDDIYLTNSGEGSKNALFRNQGDGTFKDVASEVGLADWNRAETGVSMGAVWADYDNDGFEDVLLYKWGKPELFHNDGGKHFTRVTEQATLPDWVNANSALWFDYDNDGKVDFFLGGYYAEDVNLWKLKNTRFMPESFEYAANGGRKYLFHNLGNGRFEEVSQKLGINSRRWTLAAVAADLRGTGFKDLFVANDYGVSELYLNNGGKSFTESGKETGVGYAPKSGMTASVGDVLNQGQLGIYVSNISEEGILVQGNNLWMPQIDAATHHVRYQNMANAMGVELGGWSFGGQFGDLNNDGYLDLYLVNGNVSLSKDRSYWYDYSKVAGGNRTIISDAANWPPFTGSKSLRISAEACVAKRRRRAVHRSRSDGGSERCLRRSGRGAGRLRKSRRVGRGSGKPEGSRPLVQKQCARLQINGSSSNWRVFAVTEVPLGPNCDYSGMDSNKCRKYQAAAGFVLKISGGCTLDWGEPLMSTALKFSGLPV